VVKRLKAAGFERVSTDGRHSKWQHPSGVWVPVPDSHRTISPGVVRKIDKAIEESEGN
jgi:predicted RNA binding protein YcfA (HicA-like mRNA interferase family)